MKFGIWLEGIKGNDHTYAMVIVAFLITLLASNSMQIVEKFKPSWRWLVCLLIVAVWSLLDMSKVSEFLYFQF